MAGIQEHNLALSKGLLDEPIETTAIIGLAIPDTPVCSSRNEALGRDLFVLRLGTRVV